MHIYNIYIDVDINISEYTHNQDRNVCLYRCIHETVRILTRHLYLYIHLYMRVCMYTCSYIHIHVFMCIYMQGFIDTIATIDSSLYLHL